MTERDIQKALFKQLVDGRKGRGTFRFGVPNVYFYSWESDFLGLTRSGYLWEFEIKTNQADFLADVNKKAKHQLLRMFHKSPGQTNQIPKRFYYAINGFWVEASQVPEYAGLVIVSPSGYVKTIKRAPDLPSIACTDNSLLKLATSMSYRYWQSL